MGQLQQWLDEEWVDIVAPKKKGKYQPCGRKSAKKKTRKGYPKCVTKSKAKRMTKKQKASAVKRKRAKAQGVGGKPTNVKTFARKKAADGGYMGRSIRGEYGGVNLSNPSYVKYYKGMLD